MADMLAELEAEIVNVPAQGIAKVRYTHDAMIDFIIAQPTISQNALAAKFGYTPAWISQIISSDAFQSRLAARRDELVDPEIIASVKLNFEALVLRSQALLLEKLNRPAEAIPDNLVLRTLEAASRAAGYGAKDTSINVTVNQVENHLELLGENLTRLLQRKKAELIPTDQ